MEKERIFKTLLLIGVLCTVLLVSFYYDNQTISDADLRCLQRYQPGTSLVYDPNCSNYDYNETIDLLPPEFLLELYNISVEMRFYNISVNESFEV